MTSVNSRNLRTLEAKAGHQTSLIERESINAAMEGIRAKAPGHSFIHDDDAWAGANLPSAGFVDPVERALIHKEERISVFLNSGLQAIGSSDRSIAAIRLAMSKENSLTTLRANDEARFHYIRKDKDGYCSSAHRGRRRILRYELSQRSAGIAR